MQGIRLKILQKHDLYQGRDEVREGGLRLFSIKNNENQVENFIEMVPEDPLEEQDRMEKEWSKESIATESGDQNYRNTSSKKIQQKVSKEATKLKNIYKIYKKDGLQIVKRPLFLEQTSQEKERDRHVSFTLRERGDHRQYSYFEGNKTKDRNLNLGFEEDEEPQFRTSNQGNERQYANIFSQQEEQVYVQELNQDEQMRPEIRVEESQEETQMRAEIRPEEDGYMIAEVIVEQGLDEPQNLPFFGPQNISDLSTAASLNSGNSGNGRGFFDPFEIEESTRASTNFSMQPYERNAFQFRFDEQSSINMSLSTQFLNEFDRESDKEE